MTRQIQTTDAYATQVQAIAGTAYAITSISWGTNEIETAQRAYITVSLAPLRMTWDSTTPTASLGVLVPTDSTVMLEGNENIVALQFIRSTGVSASISVTLEK